jgi:[amino group carrier protein]-lysine/ornithine hydrolase
MNREQADVLLRDMLSIYSPSGREGEIGSYLVEQMASRGFRAHLDEVGNAIGELGGGRRSIVLLGHMDTVSGFIPVREVDGRLYGRGAVDAKGPLAAFISAAALTGTPLDMRMVIIGAVEEEGDSAGARHIVDRYKPDFALVGEPSGWQHVTLGYKGSLWLEYRLERARSHLAGAGNTASEEAVSFWNRLCGWGEAFNAGIQRNFEMLTPTLVAIRSSNDGFTEGVQMEINIRWPLGLDMPAFEEWLQQVAGAASITAASREVPYRADKRNPLVSAFLASIRRAGGIPGFKLKTGTSDMNVVGPAWACPVVAYGPGDSNLDHTPDEHIDLAEYHQAIDVLAGVLRILQGPYSTCRTGEY